MAAIVFVNGFMTTAKVWEPWRAFFEEQGFVTYAPDWPYQDGDFNHVKSTRDTKRAQTDFDDLVAHYADFIKSLPEKPILMGHSLGGIVVQKLVELELAVAGVTITSGPAGGIFALNKDWIFSNIQLLNAKTDDGLVLMSYDWYHKYVTNELSLTETRDFVDSNHIPSSQKIAKSVSKQGKIDFKKPHVPLLFISGSLDKSQPPIIQKKNAAAYKDKSSRVDWISFQGRTHNILNQSNWQEVAQYVLDWIESL